MKYSRLQTHHKYKGTPGLHPTMMAFPGVIAYCLLSVIFHPHLQAQTPTPTGPEIVTRMQAVMSPENSQGRVIQTIQTTTGKTRSFEFEMYTGNKGEKVLMRYRKPTSVRGQSFLMLNHADDIWTYFPRTKRIRKLASHAKKQKVQGSDFSYEDLGSGDTWEKDYTTTNLGSETVNGTVCWKLEAVRRPDRDVSYAKVNLWVRQNDYYPVQMDYFNADNRRTKTLTMQDIRVIDGYPTAMKMNMKNHTEGTDTSMEILSMQYTWNPPPGFFSERNLKK